jgi:hypothetical protein
MKTNLYLIATTVAILTAVFSLKAQNAQTDSVFIKETFGTGTSKSALPAGRATYAYNGTSSLNDGDYMLFNRTNGRPEWHNTTDHTGDVNGKAMVINAGFTPAEFYRDTVYSLTPGVSYSVYLYVMNINTLGTCGAGALLPKLQFIVEYYNQAAATYTQLTTMNTAFIPQAATPTWLVVGSSFVLPAGITSVRYRILNNSNGGCGNDLAIDDITFARATSIPILPVTGFQAYAQRNANDINVQWETLSESNTRFYAVEKSVDAIKWTVTDSVEAAGFSQNRRTYSSIDHNPAAVNYYRIRQVDDNGRYTYSNTVRINTAANTIEAKTYPNPFVNLLQVDINASTNQKLNITCTDISGRNLFQKTWNVTKGYNSIGLTQVQNLYPGTYIINVYNQQGENIYKSKIVKN